MSLLSDFPSSQVNQKAIAFALALAGFCVWLIAIYLFDSGHRYVREDNSMLDKARRASRFFGDVRSKYGGTNFIRLLSWPRQESITTESEFEALRRRRSLVGDRRPTIYPTLLTVSAPIFVFVVGGTLSYWFGTPEYDLETFLHDPIIWVFAPLSAIFFDTIFTFDRRLFVAIEEIRPAFDVDDETFYGFFGHLVERLYEPLPSAPSPEGRRVHRPRDLLLVGTVTVVFGLQFVGNPPSGPLPIQAFLILLTFFGVFAIAVFLWILFVMFVFMTVGVADMPIHVTPTSRYDNLGLEPYSKFVVAITVRVFLTLALGGVAAMANQSPFIVSLVILNTTIILLWFVGTQYGLHVSILRSKKAYSPWVKPWHSATLEEGPTRSREANSLPISESLFETRRQVQRLPNWPVDFTSVLTVASSAGLSLIPAFSPVLRAAFAQLGI